MDAFGDFILNVIVEDVQNIHQRRRLRLQYRNLRDLSNPFAIPELQFIKNYRLNQQLVLDLIDELEEFAEMPIRSNRIPFHLQVLCSLHFYAYGSYQNGIGNSFHGPMSQSSVSRCITNISNIFAIHMMPRYVKFPVTDIEVEATKERFLQLQNFPDTIGAIDGTHIAIISPHVEDEIHPAVAYLNRKGYHSINVQGICNADLEFINVNARYPGATHDAAIWESSTILRHLQSKFHAGERNTWLIGDSGYPLQPWLMTPITDAPENTPEGRYTARHCSARNCIERCFGVLKQRFRCLLKHRVLHYSHAAAGRIIYACIVLHNICRKHNMHDVEADEENENEVGEPLDHPQDGNQVNILEEGRLIRRRIIALL